MHVTKSSPGGVSQPISFGSEDTEHASFIQKNRLTFHEQMLLDEKAWRLIFLGGWERRIKNKRKKNTWKSQNQI